MTKETPDRFIRSIRNKAKRAYAVAYLAAIRANADQIPDYGPEYGNLSYMAAQGVRMHLGYLVAQERVS